MLSQTPIHCRNYARGLTKLALRGAAGLALLAHFGWALAAIPQSPKDEQNHEGPGVAAAAPKEAAPGDFPNNRPTLALQLGHASAVTCVALSRDDTQVLTGSSDKTARLWDVASGREIRVFEHSEAVCTVAFSPDARHLLTAGYDGT